jgi:hypothetical protein
VTARLGPRATSWLAWSAFASTLVACAATVVFAILNAGADLPSDFENSADVATNVANAAVFLVFAGTGALIASRDQRNLIGWILCLAPIALAGATAVEALYAYGRYVEPGALPDGRWLIWVANWIWVLGFVPIVSLVLLLFPDGHLASRRWRPVAWLAIATGAMGVLGYAFAPGPLEDYPVVSNPVGIEGGLGSVLDAMKTIGLPLLVLAAILSATSLVLRFRRSHGEERQQLRWVAYAGAVAILLWIVGAALQAVFSEGSIVVSLGLMLFPIGIAVAVLKYRLYDLDVVINRTLVYGALTGALAAFYVGSVLLLGLVLRPFAEKSDLAIAASTLAAAAIFRPLRARIQELVDRRFYRRRYNARHTLDAFVVRLRREVDLDALRSELTGVVAETMSPAHVSLYLRPPAPAPAGRGEPGSREVGAG